MNSTMFIVGFLVYVGILVGISAYLSRSKNKGSDFLTGGMGFGFIMLFCTMGATCVGTGSSMGAIANGFRYGWGGSIYAIGAALGMFTMLIFVKARDRNFITMAEEAQFYYGGNKTVRSVTGVMIFIVMIIWLANHINGGSKYLQFVTGIGPLPAKFLVLVSFVVYVFIGGYYAVVATDVIQFTVLIIGFATIAIRAVSIAGGMEGITAAYTAAGNADAMHSLGIYSYGVVAAISLVISTYMGVISTPTYRTRIYTAKDTKTARNTLLATGIMLCFFCVLPSLLGMSAFTISSARGELLENADYAFSYLATVALGPTIGLFFMIAGLSATMSSADSDALSAVTILMTDVYPSFTGKNIDEKDYPKVSRIALIVALCIAFGMSIFATDIITFIQNVAGSLMPGIAVFMFLGRLWKRATWQGGLACIFGGTGFGLLYLFVPAINSFIVNTFTGPAIPATIISLIFGVVVSLATPACTLSDEERTAMVIACRENPKGAA